MNRRTLFKALPLAAALMMAGLSACQSASAASDAGVVPAPTVDAPKTAASKDQIAVLVDGTMELRKTCKIRAGQVVTIDDIEIHVLPDAR